ncbi:unnamed protein product [Pneumocystis jirovecii]|uniref:Protein Zds1 C-terminal domain-containing protein n=1 Tax=Pneumocystis jirovecii TaxID=42068 RepID=L0P9V6_PNEJI|nr:unnamed protein product [Pneumocystis jirovecii]
MFNNYNHIAFHGTPDDHFKENYQNKIHHNINYGNYEKERRYLNQHNSNNMFKKRHSHTNFPISSNLQGKETPFSSLNAKKNPISSSLNQEFRDLRALQKMSMETSPDLELPFTSIISIASNIYEKNNISEDSFLNPTQLHLNIIPEKHEYIKYKYQKPKIPYRIPNAKAKSINNHNNFFVQKHAFSKPVVFKEFNIESSHMNFFNSENEFQKSISQTQIPYIFENYKHASIYQPKQTFKRSIDTEGQMSFQNNDYTVESLNKHLQNTSISSQEILEETQNYTEPINTTNELLHYKNDKVFFPSLTQNRYNNFDLLKHEKSDIILSHPTKHCKNNNLPPIPHRESFRGSELNHYNSIPLSSNNKRQYHSLSNIPLSTKDYKINNNYKYITDLSNSGTTVHDQLNFSRKSPWEMFFNYEYDTNYFNKDEKSEENKIKNRNTDSLDVVKVNEISSEYFNIIRNHKPEYKNIKNILSSISNYKKKLLDKKAYFCQISKYFFAKYLKGEKYTNEYYSNSFQFESLYFTRFPIQLERFIYHLARLKLSESHRPLYQHDQIIQQSKNKLHKNVSLFSKYNIIPETIQNQIERNTRFPIKKTFENNNYNEKKTNDSINLKCKIHIPYLIDSLNPTIFDYNDLNIPFAYDDYDEFSNIHSILHENNDLYYNQSNFKNVLNSDILDSDILRPEIPIIENVHDILYI